MVRALALLLAAVLAGCARAQIITRNDPSDPNAPANAKRGGVVRYSQNDKSQAKAYAEMREYCSGAYTVTKTERVRLGSEGYVDAFGVGADDITAMEATFECQ